MSWNLCNTTWVDYASLVGGKALRDESDTNDKTLSKSTDDTDTIAKTVSNRKEEATKTRKRRNKTDNKKR